MHVVDLSWCNKKTMALLIAISHVFSLVSSASSPEELPSGSALRLSLGDEVKSYYEDIPESYTSAYLNVSRLSEHGWLWDRSDTGKFDIGTYHFLIVFWSCVLYAVSLQVAFLKRYPVYVYFRDVLLQIFIMRT